MQLNALRSVSAGHLILVNAAYPYAGQLSRDELSAVGAEQSPVALERRAAVLLEQLMANIRGWEDIAPVSGWRSRAEQQQIWDASLRDNGEAFTRQYVARPGCSEHQTGLAIDLGQRQEQIDFIRPDFPDMGCCRRFRRQAARYGYIQRYPAGKEAVTGIACEPWHFRYVGVPHAALMSSRELTLEEYLAWLQEFPWGKRPLSFCQGRLLFELSYLPQERVAELEGAAGENRLLSGDNMGGFIVTEWREQ